MDNFTFSYTKERRNILLGLLAVRILFHTKISVGILQRVATKIRSTPGTTPPCSTRCTLSQCTQHTTIEYCYWLFYIRSKARDSFAELSIHLWYPLWQKCPWNRSHNKSVIDRKNLSWTKLNLRTLPNWFLRSLFT